MQGGELVRLIGNDKIREIFGREIVVIIPSLNKEYTARVSHYAYQSDFNYKWYVSMTVKFSIEGYEHEVIKRLDSEVTYEKYVIEFNKLKRYTNQFINSLVGGLTSDIKEINDE